MNIRITLSVLLILYALTGMSNPSFVQKKCKGSITDLVVYGNTILLSTHNGWVQSFHVASAKNISEFRLPPIVIRENTKSDPYVYSVDRSPDNKQVIIASQGQSNFCNLYKWESGVLSLLMDAKESKLLIKKVRYVDEDKVLIATLSNDLILFSVEKEKVLKRTHHGTSPFTDFALNADKTKFVSSDESGVLRIFRVDDLTLIREINNIHHDEVFQLSFQKGKIASASKDQSVCVINENGELLWKRNTQFFAYNVAMSKEGCLLAFSASTEHKIELYNINKHLKIAEFEGHKAMLTRMYFYNQSSLISVADDASLFIWKIE